MNRIWSDGVFTPTNLSMFSPDFVRAQRDRDEVTLAAHTPSGHSLLLEGRNITIMVQVPRSTLHDGCIRAIQRTMHLTLNESCALLGTSFKHSRASIRRRMTPHGLGLSLPRYQW